MENSCFTLIFFLCSSKCAQINCGWSHDRNTMHSWRPRSASHCALSYQNALLSITCTKIPNSESLKLTPLQQLRVQQASRQITACDHDRINNPPPRAPNITWSNTDVLPVCVKASPVSDSPCGFVDCVLRGMLIRHRRRDPLSSQGLCTWAEIHQNICEVDLWLIEGLISSPLVFIRGGMGGRQGGSLSLFRRTGSQRLGQGRVEPPQPLVRAGIPGLLYSVLHY